MNEWHEFEERVHDELELLSDEISAVAPLTRKLQQHEPDPIELRAAATTLHAFYNGVERILVQIMRRFDDSIPNSTRWHRELLDQAIESTSDRSAIVGSELHDSLVDYLGFRHVFRHNYPATLRWRQCKSLFHRLEQVHEEFRLEIEQFLDSHKPTENTSEEE
ncbi:MAG: hypothetical protein R6V29_02045 [Spirochaetia bacterium]